MQAGNRHMLSSQRCLQVDSLALTCRLHSSTHPVCCHCYCGAAASTGALMARAPVTLTQHTSPQCHATASKHKGMSDAHSHSPLSRVVLAGRRPIQQGAGPHHPARLACILCIPTHSLQDTFRSTTPTNLVKLQAHHARGQRCSCCNGGNDATCNQLCLQLVHLQQQETAQPHSLYPPMLPNSYQTPRSDAVCQTPSKHRHVKIHGTDRGEHSFSCHSFTARMHSSLRDARTGWLWGRHKSPDHTASWTKIRQHGASSAPCICLVPGVLKK